MPGGTLPLSPEILASLDRLFLGEVKDDTTIGMVPFIQCPFSGNGPFLVTPDDFTSQGVALPRAFASNPAKLLDVVRFQSGFLLLMMHSQLVKGPRTAAAVDAWERSWKERLELGISIATIRQIFPGMPQEVDDATKTVKARMDIAIAWLLHRAIFDMDEWGPEMLGYAEDAGGSQ